MLRILIFLTIVAAIGGGLAFIAAQSGELVLLVAGQRIVLPLFTAVCLLLGTLAVILLFWWLVRVIIGAPTALREHFGVRKQQRGYQALNQGLIAAMSGDVSQAKRLTKQSHALLTSREAPLLPLLQAETKRLELDYQAAEEIFQSMLENPQTKLIGLKGLYREAIRKGEEMQAGFYAEQAVQIDAALEWAVRASVTQCAVQENWGDAVMLLERHETALRKARRSAKKTDMAHWQVALMSASAQSLLSLSPKWALDQALQAHKLAPDFVPAASIAAKSYFALGENKKGEKLIENFWRKDPHPDLGRLYLEFAAEAGKEASEREKLRRALRLEKLNPENPVTKMLVAQATLQAGDLEKARTKAQDLAETAPSEAVFLLLADIHGALGRDENIIRSLLAQAVTALPEMAWMADGQILDEWVAISPLSHRIGTCLWQRPVKHTPPLLGIPKIEQIAAVSHQPKIEEEQPPLEAQPSPKTETAPQVAIISSPALPAKQKHLPEKKKRINSMAVPPTRIIVDDPGILDEEENRP